MSEENGNAPMDQPKKNEAGLRLQSVYLKDVSVETPDDSGGLPNYGTDPGLSLEMRNHFRALSTKDGVEAIEAVIRLTVKIQTDGKTVLLIQISQAGLFEIISATPQQKEAILHVNAMEVLYPFAHQCACDMMTRTGAPRIFLPPMDFRSLYRQKLAAVESKAKPASAEGAQTS